MPGTRPILPTALVAAALASVSACSDGGSAAPGANTEVSVESSRASVTSVETTVAATTTTSVVEPTTTVGTVSTTSVHVEASTTSAPDVTSTTAVTLDGVPARVTFPDDPERQAVVDAGYAFFDAARAAQAEPESEVLRRELDGFVIAPVADGMTDYLDQLAQDGLEVVGSDISPTYLDIFKTTVVVANSSATFDACVVDSDIRVSRADGVVVDDDVVSSVQTYYLERSRDSWRVRAIDQLASWEDQVGCD
jgi:hypothetical protein